MLAAVTPISAQENEDHDYLSIQEQYESSRPYYLENNDDCDFSRFHSVDVYIPSNINDGDSIIVYSNEDYTVAIDVYFSSDGISLCDVGQSSWSGGSVPSLTTTLYPHITNPNGYTEIGFNMVVSGNENKIESAYNPTVNLNLALGLFVGISEKRISIIKAMADSTPAKASMSWIATSNINFGSVTSWLTAEFNSSRQIRISWYY